MHIFDNTPTYNHLLTKRMERAVVVVPTVSRFFVHSRYLQSFHHSILIIIHFVSRRNKWSIDRFRHRHQTKLFDRSIRVQNWYRRVLHHYVLYSAASIVIVVIIIVVIVNMCSTASPAVLKKPKRKIDIQNFYFFLIRKWS